MVVLPIKQFQDTVACRPVVLVTGGSSGLGRALAERFAKNGHDLVLVARDKGRLEGAARRIRERHDILVHTLSVDLAEDSSADAILDFLAARRLRVAVLVNNAACWVAGPLNGIDEPLTDHLVRCNVVAPVRLTRSVLPAMLEVGSGRILNVGSLAGELPYAGSALYGASKAFLRSWTFALQEELSGTGVSATLLSPGLVKDPLQEDDDARSKRHTARHYLASSQDEVARAAYRGLQAGKAHVVPGVIWPMVFASLHWLPTRWAMKLRSIFVIDKTRLRCAARSSREDQPAEAERRPAGSLG